MKKLIIEFLFGSPRTEDVPDTNQISHQKKSIPKTAKTTMPIEGITMEEWETGEWSRFNHPEYIKKTKSE